MQQSQILSVLTPDRLPEEVLQIYQSFTRRHPSWRQSGADTSVLLQRLGKWAFMPGPSMFVIQAHPRAKMRTKDMLVEITACLKATIYPVFIHVSNPKASPDGSTLINVLKSLAFQALRHDPTIVSQDPLLGHTNAFQAEHSRSEMISLLYMVLSKIQHCFVVIETADIYRSAGRDADQARQIVETFDQIFHSVTATGTVMKMLIVNHDSIVSLATSSGGVVRVVATVGSPLPASRRSKRHFAPLFGAGFGRRGLQSRFTASPK